MLALLTVSAAGAVAVLWQTVRLERAGRSLSDLRRLLELEQRARADVSTELVETQRAGARQADVIKELRKQVSELMSDVENTLAMCGADSARGAVVELFNSTFDRLSRLSVEHVPREHTLRIVRPTAPANVSPPKDK